MIDEERPYEAWIAHVRSVMVGLSILEHALEADEDAKEVHAAVNDALLHGREMASALEQANVQYLALIKQKGRVK